MTFLHKWTPRWYHVKIYEHNADYKCLCDLMREISSCVDGRMNISVYMYITRYSKIKKCIYIAAILQVLLPYYTLVYYNNETTSYIEKGNLQSPPSPGMFLSWMTSTILSWLMSYTWRLLLRFTMPSWWLYNLHFDSTNYCMNKDSRTLERANKSDYEKLTSADTCSVDVNISTI